MIAVTVGSMTAPSTETPPTDTVKGGTPPLVGGPVLGLAAAAKACGVSVSTIRRKREDLEELGAVATPSGWRIPIAALVGSGLMPPTTQPPAHDSPVRPPVGGGDAPSETLREELETLRSRLAAAEQRAAVAEAIAAERERLIESQAMALRMLEAPVTATPTTSPAPPVEPVPGQPQVTSRLTLWQRIRGASATR
jgi:hypothetical protein